MTSIFEEGAATEKKSGFSRWWSSIRSSKSQTKRRSTEKEDFQHHHHEHQPSTPKGKQESKFAMITIPESESTNIENEHLVLVKVRHHRHIIRFYDRFYDPKTHSHSLLFERCFGGDLLTHLGYSSAKKTGQPALPKGMEIVSSSPSLRSWTVEDPASTQQKKQHRIRSFFKRLSSSSSSSSSTSTSSSSASSSTSSPSSSLSTTTASSSSSSSSNQFPDYFPSTFTSSISASSNTFKDAKPRERRASSISLPAHYTPDISSLTFSFHKKDGQRREQKARQVCQQIGSALRFAHHKGILHGNVKLENIFFRDRKGSEAVLVDWSRSQFVHSSNPLHTGICGVPHLTISSTFSSYHSCSSPSQTSLSSESASTSNSSSAEPTSSSSSDSSFLATSSASDSSFSMQPRFPFAPSPSLPVSAPFRSRRRASFFQEDSADSSQKRSLSSTTTTTTTTTSPTIPVDIPKPKRQLVLSKKFEPSAEKTNQQKKPPLLPLRSRESDLSISSLYYCPPEDLQAMFPNRKRNDEDEDLDDDTATPRDADRFASDMWGLGVVIYAILSGGRLPYVGETKDEVLAQIHAGIPPLPKNIKPSFGCMNLLQCLLEPNPSLRITSDQLLNHPWMTANNPLPSL